MGSLFIERMMHLNQASKREKKPTALKLSSLGRAMDSSMRRMMALLHPTGGWVVVVGIVGGRVVVVVVVGEVG